MDMIPVAIIAAVLLTGVVTLALGARGWNVANTVAAWLVLLASTVFLVLAGIRGQSERAWSGLIREKESRLLEVRDAVRPAAGGEGLERLGECSVEALQNCAIEELELKRQEWARALERINTWRGRFWTEATFTPPRKAPEEPPKEPKDEPKESAWVAGRIKISSVKNPSIEPGAELYVFDVTPPSEGGRFLGGFRVVGPEKKENEKKEDEKPAADDNEQENNDFEVEPLGRVDAKDLEAWSRPREEVTVYENLPFDRWAAFHRTGKEAEATVLPEPRKRLPEEGDPLRPAVEKHTFPEEVIASAGDKADDSPFPEDPDVPPPGVDWARVEFEEAFTWAPEGTDGAPAPARPVAFEAGKVVSAFPAREIAAIRKAGAKFKHTWVLPPGLYWAEVEFTEDTSFENPSGEPLEFTTGQSARLPLATAEKLADEKKVTIKRRLHRRPLVDPSTELRGLSSVAGPPGQEPGPDGGAAVIDVGAIGIYRRFVEIERRVKALEAMTAEMKLADESAKGRIQALNELRESLERDLTNWEGDVTAATKLAQAAEGRLETLAETLDKAEKAITEQGEYLRKTMATLATEIDRRTIP